MIGALESVGNQGKVLINGRTVAGRDNGYVDTLVSFLFEFIEVMRAKELYRREITALREKHPLTTRTRFFILCPHVGPFFVD